MLFLGCVGLCSSAAILLAGSELVSLCRVLVPQILVPEHPAVIDGVAVGAVVVAISWIFPFAIVTIVGLATNVVVEVSAKVEEHGVGRVGSGGVGRLHLLLGHHGWTVWTYCCVGITG